MLRSWTFGLSCFGLLLVACASHSEVAATHAPTADNGTNGQPTVTPHRLPDAPGSARLDYLAIDRAHVPERVWIPGADTGNIDILEADAAAILAVAKLPTAAKATEKGARILGPSSATIEGGVVWLGNRADSRLCGFSSSDAHAVGCVALPASPDGVVTIPWRHEVWVTAPDEKELIVIDVQNSAMPKLTRTLALSGEPEGYAVDQSSGHLFTNLEDTDRTLVVDVASGTVAGDYAPGCGKDGPRGIAFDSQDNVLVVACTDHLVTLDAKSGKTLGTLAIGAGVDNIDILVGKRLLFAAAGKVGTLTVAHLDGGGAMHAVRTVQTSKSTRVVVAGSDGTAYVADPLGARVLVVKPPASGW